MFDLFCRDVFLLILGINAGRVLYPNKTANGIINFLYLHISVAAINYCLIGENFQEIGMYICSRHKINSKFVYRVSFFCYLAFFCRVKGALSYRPGCETPDQFWHFKDDPMRRNQKLYSYSNYRIINLITKWGM